MQNDTKSRLMDAAEQRVRRSGPDGFSYADLSADVGIRKASIHYHFPAKSDLLTAIMRRYRKQVLSDLQGYSADLPTAAGRIDAFINLYRDALQDGASLCLCVAYAVSREGLAVETRQEIDRFRTALTVWLEQTFRQAAADGSIADMGDPRAESAAVLALAEGAQIAARIGRDVAVFDDAMAAIDRRLIIQV